MCFMMAQVEEDSIGNVRIEKRIGEIGWIFTPNLPSAFTKSFHTFYDYLSPHY